MVGIIFFAILIFVYRGFRKGWVSGIFRLAIVASYSYWRSLTVISLEESGLYDCQWFIYCSMIGS